MFIRAELARSFQANLQQLPRGRQFRLQIVKLVILKRVLNCLREDFDVRKPLGAFRVLAQVANHLGQPAVIGQRDEGLVDGVVGFVVVGDQPVSRALLQAIVQLLQRGNVGRHGFARGLVRGTAFQQRVWQALREIPAGKTASYAEIANRLGAPNAVRAVAGACAANALAVAIPCHRVVRTDGSLAGYYWGVERKKALIAREAGEEAAA